MALGYAATVVDLQTGEDHEKRNKMNGKHVLLANPSLSTRRFAIWCAVTVFWVVVFPLNLISPAGLGTMSSATFVLLATYRTVCAHHEWSRSREMPAP
jgi:hypothetical protein